MTTGILLVTLGGPRTRDEVPAFLRSFVGRDLPPPVLKAITERYDLIGGGSPLDEISERQAAALQDLLGPGFVCRAAFRHSTPSFADALEALRAEDAERVVFLSMSPFFSSVTTGGYIAHANDLLVQRAWGAQVLWVHSWHENPFFLAAWAEKIAAAPAPRGAAHVFTAHSVPERLAGEPYRAQIERTVDAIAARHPLERWTVGWQSVPAGAREPWIGPQVEEVLGSMAERGVKAVVEIPVGFTADHIETLYDMDIVHRRHAESLGLSWARVPSLNAAPPFIRALAQIVDAALAHPEKHTAK